MTLTAPASLTWAGTLNGLTQDFADTATTDETYNVTDATGGTTGWNVSVAATNFTDASSATLPSTGTFFTNGSVTVPADTTAPTAACTSGAGTCTLPTNAITYPVDVVTTAPLATAAPSVIYEAAGGTGLGSIDIGGSTAANPVGWWITTRPDTAPGTYTSTITLTLATGP